MGKTIQEHHQSLVNVQRVNMQLTVRFDALLGRLVLIQNQLFEMSKVAWRPEKELHPYQQ